MLPTVRKVLARYPHIRRLVMVADRGLLSLDNLSELSSMTLPSGQPLEFILAVPGRRYGEFIELLQSLHESAAANEGETLAEAKWQGHRLVVAHEPVRAQEQTALRASRIAALQARAQQLAAKLDGQDAGEVHRGRKLSDSGAKARFFHEVAEAHLSKIIKVDLKSDLFAYDIDDTALRRAQMMDGKLLLVTNVADLSAREIVDRYKSRADIERGFKVLKSEIEIAPVFHRLPERIRAHASICFMALILYRVMRQRLKLAGHSASPETALAQLRRIQRQSVSINQGVPITGISTINREQAAVLAALNIRKPAPDPQLNLL
jgi:transposase